MLKLSFTVPEKHPSLQGHFPGHPLVPGVLTLDYVVCGLLEQFPGMELTGLPQIKFLQPLPAQIQVDVFYRHKYEMLYQFRCESQGLIIVQGQIQLAAYGRSTEKKIQ